MTCEMRKRLLVVDEGEIRRTRLVKGAHRRGLFSLDVRQTALKRGEQPVTVDLAFGVPVLVVAHV